MLKNNNACLLISVAALHDAKPPNYRVVEAALLHSDVAKSGSGWQK